MTLSWIDAVGPSVVAALAKEYSLQLTPQLVQFLNRYGDRVDAAGRSRTVNSRKASRARQELNEVVREVRVEVHRLQADLRPSYRQQVKELNVVKHIETYLPVVYCRLEALPMLVIHVGRTYATCRRAIHGLGFRQEEYCGGKLSGRVGRAANYVQSSCRKFKWQLSVSEALNIWITAALDIPLKDRRAAMAVKNSFLESSLQAKTKLANDEPSAEARLLSPLRNSSRSVVESGDLIDPSDDSDPSPKRSAQGKRKPANLAVVKDGEVKRPKPRKRSCTSDPEETNPSVEGTSPSHRSRKYTRVEAAASQADLAPTSSAELRASVTAALDAQEEARASRMKLPGVDKLVVSIAKDSSAAGLTPSDIPPPRSTSPLNTAPLIPDTYSHFKAGISPSMFSHFDNSDIATEGMNLKMEQEFFIEDEEVIASGGGADYLLSTFPVEGVTRDPGMLAGEKTMLQNEEVIATGGGDEMVDSKGTLKDGNNGVKRTVTKPKSSPGVDNAKPLPAGEKGKVAKKNATAPTTAK